LHNKENEKDIVSKYDIKAEMDIYININPTIGALLRYMYNSIIDLIHDQKLAKWQKVW